MLNGSLPTFYISQSPLKIKSTVVIYVFSLSMVTVAILDFGRTCWIKVLIFNIQGPSTTNLVQIAQVVSEEKTKVYGRTQAFPCYKLAWPLAR